jgi:hypothetical protein
MGADLLLATNTFSAYTPRAYRAWLDWICINTMFAFHRKIPTATAFFTAAILIAALFAANRTGCLRNPITRSVALEIASASLPLTACN